MTHAFFDFHERFNEWVEDDDPPDDFRFWVLAWLTRLQDDPTADAAPALPMGEPWWFAKIPRAEDRDRAVVCLYSIAGNTVRCSGFTILSKPIS